MRPLAFKLILREFFKKLVILLKMFFGKTRPQTSSDRHGYTETHRALWLFFPTGLQQTGEITLSQQRMMIWKNESLNIIGLPQLNQDR